MMLVHKPQAISLASPASYSHRRHPSAPVVVQPTRVPGLLSLSKPPRTCPQNRQLPSYQRQSPRLAPKAAKPSQVVRAHNNVLTPAAEITATAPAVAPATPSPQPRGRTQAKNLHHLKDKAARSVSTSFLRGKHGRQPSPPIQQQLPTSQAEAPPIKSTNLFDPFLDSAPPSPSLTSQPTGKLAARRRQQQQQPSPSPALSKAVAIPSTTPRSPTSSNIARSEPTTSHLKQRPRPLPKRSSTLLDFPVCDDLAEAADTDAPLTPRRLYGNGPQTAPISARTPGAFPFMSLGMASPPPSPISPKKNRNHRRTPSEGIFHMSSDEELSTGPGGAVLNPSVHALFGLTTPVKASAPSPFVTPSHSRVATPRTRDSSPSHGSSTESLLAGMDAAQKANFFASSMFQNSPSPDELPDPLLL